MLPCTGSTWISTLSKFCCWAQAVTAKMAATNKGPNNVLFMIGSGISFLGRCLDRYLRCQRLGTILRIQRFRAAHGSFRADPVILLIFLQEGVRTRQMVWDDVLCTHGLLHAFARIGSDVTTQTESKISRS